ncbi:MAG: DUF1080 domain-containing protein [Phycisphaerales bacterium]|nr:DUF1080 domain-containing protein [Phycisphaerales bacterium]
MRQIWTTLAVFAVMLMWIGMARPALGAPQRDPPSPTTNTLSDQEKQDGWTLLFDGATLANWKEGGEAGAWGAKDGELIALKPGKGWWLRTDRMYRDFELVLDFNVPPKGNSGVGLRGSSNGDPAFTGFEVQIFDSHGQEPAINNCGAVYGAIIPSEMAVNPAGEWNSYRIKLVGDTLNVWLNGKQIHTEQKLDDRGFVHDPANKSPLRDRATTGYISLQDHGDPIRYRNLKIRDLSPDPEEPGFKPLITEKLDLWTPRGGGEWKVEDGTLVGRDGPGHLFTNEKYGNLEIRALVRVNAKGNSGLYFRTVPRPEDPNTWPLGYESQVDNHDPKNFTGCIYDRAWPNAEAAGMKGPVSRDNAWFDYRIRTVGDHVQTWINGVPVVDAFLTDFKEGHIALQTHHKGNQIEWRDLRVKAGPKVSVRTRRPDEPVRVFYCTHSVGYRHEVLPETVQILKQKAAELDWLEFAHSDDIRDLTPEVLASVDIVMLYTSGDIPLDVEMLAGWVESGGSLVGVHSATDTLRDNPRYIALIGARFESHPWNEEVRVVADQPQIPMMASLMPLVAQNPSSFSITDEIYEFSSVDRGLGVLASLDGSTPGASLGRQYPLSWIAPRVDGKVFYSAFGHGPETWRNPKFIDHLLSAVQWCAERCPVCEGHLKLLPIHYGMALDFNPDMSNGGQFVRHGCVVRAATHARLCMVCNAER